MMTWGLRLGRVRVVCLFLFYVLATPKVAYQDGYWLVMVHTHGDFIVLLHWETRLSVP